MSYVRGHTLPDYRGGVSIARNFGRFLAAESNGLFAATNTDGVFISRFGNAFLVYQQTRFGYSWGPKLLRAQAYWNFNLTIDDPRRDGRILAELGPGIRFHGAFMPPSMYLIVDSMQGAYLIHGSYPVAHFADLRAGVWYAITR